MQLAESCGGRESASAWLLTAKSHGRHRGERELLLCAARGWRRSTILSARLLKRSTRSATSSATTDLRGYLDSQRRRLAWAERMRAELVDMYSEISLACWGEYAEAVEHAQAALREEA